MSKIGLGIFLFFMVASNLHINLFIKLWFFPGGVHCSDCLQQKRLNQNPLSARISRARGPTHPYLCDVKANHHLKGFFFNGGHMYEFKTLICHFQKENKPFSSNKSKE